MQSKANVPVKPVKTVKPAPQAKAASPAAKKDTPKPAPVTFTAHAHPGSTVYLAGSFNNWDPAAIMMENKKGGCVFTVSLNLPAGEHQYKFVIDGAWSADPLCPDWAPNDQGTLNSVRHVR